MSAAEQFSYGSVQHKANAVEVCECPEGYTGTSCEVLFNFFIKNKNIL